VSGLQELLAELQRELRPLGRRARRGVLREARDHLMTGIEAEIETGASDEEAERRVVERYGDAAVVARSVLLAHPRKPGRGLQIALLAIGAATGIAGTVLVAASRDSPRAKRHAVQVVQTADSVDQMANDAARKRFLGGLATDPASYTPSGFPIASPLRADTPVRKLFQIPEGSVYAGHRAWVAGPAGGYQCWAALDGGSCGTLSRANPVVAFSLSHPASDLPDVMVGITSPQVVSIAITCPWGTSHPKIVGRKGFAAVGPHGSFESCSTFEATFADGTVMVE
jgi:hypothetical protein